MLLARKQLTHFLFACFSILVSAACAYSFQRPAQPRRAPIDYSKFSHSTQKHKGACNTCHVIPTVNWQKTSGYPDVIDYPGHNACVSCHRAQFFKGAKPPICSVCHTKTSPRDEARYAFRNPNSKLQFTIEFPHDRH